jgi:dienelactone hydrolase
MADPPRLHVSPATDLVDAALDVRVRGGRAGSAVGVHARVDDPLRGRWHSAAVFRVSAAGEVDLACAPPDAGNYATADPLGLLWSLERDTANLPPVGFAGPSEPFDVELTVEVDGAVADRARIRRCFMGSGVARAPVRDDGLVGTFFAPASPPPSPGVLVVGGSDGGLAEGTAALLASYGFAVLALAYFRAEHLPAELIEIPLEYFETALHWLGRRRGVARDRLGVVGRSRGGELALLLGATFPAVTAVVGYVPSGVVHAGLAASPAEAAAPRSAWTHHGKPLPFLPPPLDARTAGDPPAMARPLETPFELTPLFLKRLEDPAAVEAAVIPVERIRGPVLLVSGDDDRLWPSPRLAEIAVARLTAHGRAATHLCYPGAGHMIGPRGLPATANTIIHPLRSRALALGGTPVANAAAAADSWPRVLTFLRTSLAAP